ncbi:hypothetical protein DAEQUDRAFT_729562 [Daedalea quercina L-15889]|uniref:F-box domain-containing protein n=1 Tax=Daedalea quercina L-15889 TaxID=1314783 RepID=A0A165NM11_9APHY|nr:hypothetical protein DAEQUDRAFT_729562 [Daedalea quercina L-15889]
MYCSTLDNCVSLDDGHTNCRNFRTTIDDLPSDVLLAIFGVLSRPRQSSTSWPILEGQGRFGADRLLPKENPDAEHAFPYCLATVCRTWRTIMSTVSIFWTRQIIWVGKKPTPTSWIREHIAWSRDHPIDIYVMRRFDPSLSDPTEKAQVDAVMEVLMPHMHRWRVLCMKLLHSSSLPRPRIDLVGTANELRKLRLDFVLYEPTTNAELAALVPTDNFHTPLLESLSLSGLHFRELYMKPSLYAPLPPKLSDLAVSEYPSHYPPFPLVEFLTCLTSHLDMGRLTLDNLRLNCSYDGEPIRRLGKRGYWDADVHFVDMSGDVISEYNRLLDYPYVDLAWYTRCSMDASCQLGESYRLILESIADPSVLYRLLNGVEGTSWCQELTFIDCDGLNGAFLHTLATPRSTPDGNDWPCPDVSTLTIKGCKRFSSFDLRMLLEPRRKVHQEAGFRLRDEDPDYQVHSVTYLYVSNCCRTEQDDKDWLKKNVASLWLDDY